MSNTKLPAEVQRRVDLLEQWKTEATLILDPIFEYGRKHPDIKPGQSMSTFIIERCKQHDELKAENERLTKAADASIDNTNDAMRQLTALKEKAEAYEKALELIASKAYTFPNEYASKILSAYNSEKGGEG